MTLDQAVPFGHPSNDPVSVVLAIAAIDADDHVGAVSELATVLADPGAIVALAAASSGSEVRAILRGSHGHS